MKRAPFFFGPVMRFPSLNATAIRRSFVNVRTKFFMLAKMIPRLKPLCICEKKIAIYYLCIVATIFVEGVEPLSLSCSRNRQKWFSHA